MRHHLVVSAVCLLLTSSLQAQTTNHTVSPAAASLKGNTNSANPFGYDRSLGTTRYGMRFQQIFDHQSFTNQNPVLIKEIRLRKAPGVIGGSLGGHSVDMSVWIALANTSLSKPITSDNLTKDFVNNIDAKSYINVIKRKNIVMPKAPNPGFGIKIPFDASSTFLYAASQKKNLVVEVRVHGNSTRNYVAYPLDAYWTTLQGVGSYVPNGSYKGCRAKNGNFVQHFSAETTLVIGTKLNNHYGYGWLGATPKPAFMTLGATPMNLKLGTTSCYVMNNVIALIPGFTQGNFAAFFANVPIPNEKRLVDVQYLTQMFFLEAGANALGITSTRGLKNKIGQGKPTQTSISSVAVVTPKPDTESAGVVTYGFGLVMRFQ